MTWGFAPGAVQGAGLRHARFTALQLCVAPVLRTAHPLILTPPPSVREPELHTQPGSRGGKDMTQFHAQPYDLHAQGFYFEDAESYLEKIDSLRNDFGDPVEEFEIQFIDGKAIDCDLAKAWGINQANILRFLEIIELWDDAQKIRFILAVGECGYGFDPEQVDPDDFDVDLYYVESMRELAEDFVEEGLFGEIPETLRFYIDYDAIARDLAMDYGEASVAGQTVIYRCG